MSSTITHSYFVKDLYDVLPDNITPKLDINRLKMFAQSTDSVMFYNILSLKKGKNFRKFQSYFHTHKTNEFFINLLRYVRLHNIDDVDTYSFIVGFISHYILDSTVHPYIIYKTGMFNKKIPSTYKYNNIHHFMETFLDNDLLIRRENINPYKFKISKYCFDTKKFSTSLNEVIDSVFDETFNIKNMSSKYYKSLKQMKTFITLFRRDRFGIKNFFYKIIDTFTPRSVFRFEALSYHYPLNDKNNFLNSNHNIWRNPSDYDMTSTEAYVDLYLKALKNTRSVVIKTFDYLNGEDIDLDKLFLNKNYMNGLDCDEEKELKFFEF